MSEAVYCPKCSSTQITAQQRGFSGGKAIAGALLTGGIGLVAGFHGSSNVDVVCLACGHKWNPAKRAASEKQAELVKRDEHEKRWWGNFIRLYENGNHVAAREIILRERPELLASNDLEGAYRSLRGSVKFNAVFIDP